MDAVAVSRHWKKKHGIFVLLFVVLLTIRLHFLDVYTDSMQTDKQVRRIPVIGPYLNVTLDSCPGQIRFLERPMRLTVLASYPGSGNTWLRHLVEKMTGYATGSNWSDMKLQVYGGFIGEFVKNESTILVKTHNDYDARAQGPIESTDRVILLIRNPYDTLLSEFNRYYTGADHIGVAYISAFIKHWHNYTATNAGKWEPFYSNWLHSKHVLLVLYEDLKENLKFQLSRILNFLDDGQLTGHIDCALESKEGRFHRYRQFQPRTTFFYDRNVDMINEAIDTLQRNLRKRFPSENIDLSLWKMKV